ncbi:hypothetical protein D2A91_12595 [Enterococcus faecalis]|nr:hypothetical protein [Enterococcus faecalis]
MLHDTTTLRFVRINFYAWNMLELKDPVFYNFWRPGRYCSSLSKDKLRRVTAGALVRIELRRVTAGALVRIELRRVTAGALSKFSVILNTWKD